MKVLKYLLEKIFYRGKYRYKKLSYMEICIGLVDDDIDDIYKLKL